MKKLLLIALVAVSVIGYLFFLGAQNQTQSNSEYLRIHIRANSNLTLDQDIKYQIKDELVQALYPIVANSETKQQLQQNLKDKTKQLTEIAQNCLHKANLTYTAKISLNSEYFPTRVYNSNTVLESGVYDALIVELGEAKGDNWWCVIYPPLCFMNVNYNGSENITFKSRIAELIRKYFS